LFVNTIKPFCAL